MKDMFPKIAPGVLIRPIDGDYHYTVNCTQRDSLRILTALQRAFLGSLNDGTSVAEFAERHAISVENSQMLFESFVKSGILLEREDLTCVRKPEFPTALDFWIHTTNACNLGCSYCYISTLHTSGGMSDEVKSRFLEKLVETVEKRNITKIRLRLAGGEPLTQFKSWQHFIPNARQLLGNCSCNLEISFLTNLTLLTDEIIDFAKKEHISFSVSIDGLKEDHNRARPYLSGRGSFATIARNIRKLLENGLQVSINTVVTNNNLYGLPALTDYLIGLDIPFRLSIVKGDKIDGAALEQSLSICFDKMAAAVQKGWTVSGKFQFCDLKPRELGFQTCSSGFSGGAINVDGTFNYCHVHFGDSVQQDISIYNNDLDLVTMIEQGPHLEEIKSNDCKACPYRAVCTSGCPVYRVGGKDPQCSIYHKFIPRIYDLHALERLHLLQLHGII
ncbi:radical SAM protein [Dyadobacter sp. 32]|uniref:radical SAM protein n=1 Tax=Dyadobacter sp. 32 TaxID=538966 RepID=UPI0039C64582